MMSASATTPTSSPPHAASGEQQRCSRSRPLPPPSASAVLVVLDVELEVEVAPASARVGPAAIGSAAPAGGPPSIGFAVMGTAAAGSAARRVRPSATGGAKSGLPASAGGGGGGASDMVAAREWAAVGVRETKMVDTRSARGRCRRRPRPPETSAGANRARDRPTHSPREGSGENILTECVLN